jgi:arsenite methyltransferase
MNQFSASISNRYDSLAGQACCLSCGAALSLADIKPGFVCIDLGSGKGHDVLRMAVMAGETGFAYGIDISDGMMETARNNADKLHLKHVAFIKSELENIQLESDLADVVISNCTINHSLNQAAVWKEISRVLKPGGSFVVSDIFALEKVPEAFASDPEAVAACWAGAVTKDIYLQNIINAGLSDIEILEESLPYEKGSIFVASFTIKGTKPQS